MAETETGAGRRSPAPFTDVAGETPEESAVRADEAAPTPAPAPKPARLTVTVVRADGSPAAGARVVVARSDEAGDLFQSEWYSLPEPCAPLTTDAEGRATFEAEHFWLAWASASDGDQGALVPRRVSLRAGDAGAVTLTLVPSFRVRGEVTDIDGSRIRHADARMLVPDPVASSLSSYGHYAWLADPVVCANGEFEFAPVLPRDPPQDEMTAWLTPRSFWIRAEAEGFLDGEAEFQVDEASVGARLTIRLFRTGRLRGRLVDSDGVGVPGVLVAREPVWNERFEQDAWGGSSDAAGHFEIADFPEIGGTLSCTGGSHAGRTVPVPRFDPRAGHDLGEIVLDAGQTVRGRVVDPSGAPVQGASVWSGDASGTTDREGRFVVEHLPPGPWRVFVRDDVGMRKGSLMVTDTGSEVVIVASNDRHVHLRIRFETGSEPPAEPPYVLVTWRRADEAKAPPNNEQWHRKRYELWLQPEQPGEWIVRAEMAGWEAAEAPVVVRDGHAVEADLTLRKRSP